jgi:hypothetical protein
MAVRAGACEGSLLYFCAVRFRGRRAYWGANCVDYETLCRLVGEKPGRGPGRPSRSLLRTGRCAVFPWGP